MRSDLATNPAPSSMAEDGLARSDHEPLVRALGKEPGERAEDSWRREAGERAEDWRESTLERYVLAGSRMMSASIALTSGSASARSSFAMEQHECTHVCCGRGRGVYGGRTPICCWSADGVSGAFASSRSQRCFGDADVFSFGVPGTGIRGALQLGGIAVHSVCAEKRGGK